MTNKFEVGDYVYAGDFIFGYITDIEGDTACVEYDTGSGGGSLAFNLSELEHAEEPYDPRKHGAVVAIRIFMDEEKQISPMAELAFAYGGTAVIDWVDQVQRGKYMSGINGYTLIYDERPKREFSDWIKETKIYRKICYGKIAMCARVVRFKNGKYGFETCSYGKFEVWEKNVNMPSFPTEEAAVRWIENNSKWQ